MNYYELFSCCRKGEMQDSKFQYHANGDLGVDIYSIDMTDWINMWLFSYNVHGYNLRNHDDKHEQINDFLNYHLKKYNAVYNQNDPLSFITSLELLLPSIKASVCNSRIDDDTIAKGIQSIDEWISLTEKLIKPSAFRDVKVRYLDIEDLFSTCNNSQGIISEYQFYKRTDQCNIKTWLKGILYCQIIQNHNLDSVDLSNAALKNKYLINFLNFHLKEFNRINKVDNNIEFAVHVDLLIRDLDIKQFKGGEIKYVKRINQMIEKWCWGKLPIDLKFLPNKNTNSGYDILKPHLSSDKLEMLWQELINLGCITSKTDLSWIGNKNLCAYLVDRINYEILGLNGDAGKQIKWKPFEELFRIRGLRIAKNDYVKTGALPSMWKRIDKLLNKIISEI